MNATGYCGDVIFTFNSFGLEHLDGSYERQPSLCTGKVYYLCVQGCTGPDKYLTYEEGIWAIRASACSNAGVWAKLDVSNVESPNMAITGWSVWMGGAWMVVDQARFYCGGTTSPTTRLPTTREPTSSPTTR
eukprot:4019868-Pyramimonas_sp.AAC.1